MTSFEDQMSDMVPNHYDEVTPLAGIALKSWPDTAPLRRTPRMLSLDFRVRVARTEDQLAQAVDLRNRAYERHYPDGERRMQIDELSDRDLAETLLGGLSTYEFPETRGGQMMELVRDAAGHGVRVYGGAPYHLPRLPVRLCRHRTGVDDAQIGRLAFGHIAKVRAQKAFADQFSLVLVDFAAEGEGFQRGGHDSGLFRSRL